MACPRLCVFSAWAGGLSRSGTRKRTHEVTLPALICRMLAKPKVVTTTSLSAKVRGWDELPDADRAPHDDSVPLNWSIPGTPTDTPGATCSSVALPWMPRPQPQQHRAGGSRGEEPTTWVLQCRGHTRRLPAWGASGPEILREGKPRRLISRLVRV